MWQHCVAVWVVSEEFHHQEDRSETMSDIFVVLPPATADNMVLFAKNSDRPPTEIQDVVYVPPNTHTPGSKLQVCNFVNKQQFTDLFWYIIYMH